MWSSGVPKTDLTTKSPEKAVEGREGQQTGEGREYLYACVANAGSFLGGGDLVLRERGEMLAAEKGNERSVGGGCFMVCLCPSSAFATESFQGTFLTDS